MATTTTNYGLLKPAATDSYNHLVYDNPNMDTIDAAMKANSDAAITSATCIKSGTTHTIVRSNTSAPVFRFTATGDWNAGDTMIVDGVSVTPYHVDGSALLDGAYVINTDVLAIISGSRVTIFGNGINLIDASKVVYDNTSSGLSATNIQDAVDEVASTHTVKMYQTAITTDSQCKVRVADLIGEGNKNNIISAIAWIQEQNLKTIIYTYTNINNVTDTYIRLENLSNVGQANTPATIKVFYTE